MSAEVYGYDLFARHTATDGTSYVACHRVWDKERFVAVRTAEALQLNEKVKQGEPRKAMFEQITETEYLKGRKK